MLFQPTFRFALLLPTLVLISACSTAANYATAVNSWHGANMNTLYHQWGYPNKTKRLANGHQLLTYHASHRVQTPTTITNSSTETASGHHQHTTIVSTGTTNVYRCTTWFETKKNGVIVNTSFRGNDCTATDHFLTSHGYAPHLPAPTS